MDVETQTSNFYNKFPYPNFDIKSKSDLDTLGFQKFLFEIGKSYVEKNSKILDAGCGTGELALLFGSKGFDSYGTDKSEKSLQIAKRASEKLGIDTNFKKMDVLNLDFPKNYFDMTICNGVLHHTKDPILGFENLIRVTKPGGTVMIVVYNKYGGAPRKLVGKIARLLGGGTKEKQVKFLRKILGRKFKNKSDAVMADTFLNPYELSFSINEVLSWFEKYNVKYTESVPPIELKHYPKVVSEVVKKRSLLSAWMNIRDGLQQSSSSYNQLSFLLVQLLWFTSLKGNIFLIIGEKHRD